MAKSTGPMHIVSATGGKPSTDTSPSDEPPKVPPRMKKKGPALPEKPPHIKAKISAPNSVPSTPSSQQIVLREPLKPRISNVNRHSYPQREVLVAATRGAIRERPVDKRQREPPKLLMPTSGGSTPKKEIVLHPSARSALDDLIYGRKSSFFEKRSSKPLQQQPILLIPRGMLPPVSCALWMQQREAASARRGAAPRRETSGQILLLPEESSRSGSVTRSGSLTSQGSSSSDSETFPKSVLKKQKRNKINGGSCRKFEQKKNVTFNAFATVQLMEE